jgi:molybdopterin-binding protein
VLVQSGTIAEITAHPRSRYVADLIGTNLIAGTLTADGLVTTDGVTIAVVTDLSGPAFAVIRPQSVTLSSDASATSARNTITGRVDGIDRLGDRVRVSVDGPLRLVAEITARALDAMDLRPGDTVAVEPHRGSNWVVVAVAGGLVVPSLLGSCSADTLGGIIPFPVTDGVEIPVGVPAEPVTAISDLAIVPRRGDRAVVSPGPRVDWFVEGALGELWRSTWTVTASSRIGVRLDGPVIARVDERELPSEGLVAGAVQIPPDGHPIVMGPDHPVTGGYPVIGIVRAADLAMVLDRPVGSRIGFLPP